MQNSLKVIQGKVLALLPKAEGRYLLAFSGGIDSVFLAHVLLNLNYRFELAHVNYGLRDAESEENMQFCKHFAQRHSIKLHIKTLNTDEKEMLENGNVQNGARAIRYTWFDKIMASNSLNGLVTAHQADDQIETVLFHQIRGTGIQGLIGMQKFNGRIFRPLLDFSKADLIHIANEMEWSFSADSSNNTNKYSRNFLRNEIIPIVESRFPAFRNTMLQNISVWQDEHSLLNYFSALFLKDNLVVTPKTEELSIKALLQLPSKKTILHKWLASYGFNDSNYLVVERNLEKFAGEKKVELHNADLFLLRDKLLLKLHSTISINNQGYNFPIEADNSTQLEMGGRAFSVKISVSQGATVDSKKAIYLDERFIGSQLSFRTWEKGDKIRLRGLNGSKKLSDLFIQLKLSSDEKQSAIVVLLEEKIIAVWPYKVADGFDIKEKGQLQVVIDL